jgi:hypothetical protein
MPPCRVGGELPTVDHGNQIVRGITDAPVPWPYAVRWSRRSLCLTGDLVLAVRCETVVAVASWWGVSRSTVRIWRRALGVARFNPGTLECWRRSAPRLQKGRQKKG